MVTGSPDPHQEALQNRSGHALAPRAAEHLALPCTDFLEGTGSSMDCTTRDLRKKVLEFPSQYSPAPVLPNFGSDPGMQSAIPEAVGPLGLASSHIRCCVTHRWPCCVSTPLSYSLELALVHLRHSPQASGGTGTWVCPTCQLPPPHNPLCTPRRASVPRVSSGFFSTSIATV